MSKYIVTLDPGEVVHDGMTKYIKCPCDCYGVTDVILKNAEGGVVGTFSLCDATGKTTSDVGNVWSAGHYIQVRFDLSAMKAQVLNGASSKHASEHASTGTDPITPKSIGAASADHNHDTVYAKTANYTVSVGTSWTEDTTNGGYYQTVAVSGILETDDPITDIVLGSDVDANTAYLEAWGNVTRITTGDNSITLWANTTAPATAFTVKMKVVR